MEFLVHVRVFEWEKLKLLFWCTLKIKILLIKIFISYSSNYLKGHIQTYNCTITNPLFTHNKSMKETYWKRKYDTYNVGACYTIYIDIIVIYIYSACYTIYIDQIDIIVNTNQIQLSINLYYWSIYYVTHLNVIYIYYKVHHS